MLTCFLCVALIFSTVGYGWSNQEGWLSDESVREWELVVECMSGSMVTKLDLGNNKLVGNIPLELTHFRSLGKKVIVGFQLTIDVSSHSPMLSFPSLRNNQLNEQQAVQNDSHLVWVFEDMEILRLGGSLLMGNIPPELADMVNLQELYLRT